MSTASLSTPHSGRRMTLWGVTVVFCLIALFTSGYLSWTTLTNTHAVCIEGDLFDCSKVEGSIYSEVMGIKVAYLGFATYVTILAVLLLERRVAFVREYGMLLILGLALFGFLFHSYLTYMSIARLGALCPWCVVTNFSMGVILVATVIRVVRKFVLMPEE